MELEYPDGATPLDADEIEGLIPIHITKQSELNEWESDNILNAMEWLQNSKEEVLSEKYIKKLHKKMFSETWKWAGKFRLSNKNIGVNWETIGPCLRDLLEDTKTRIHFKSYSNTKIAVLFYHRLVFIHCFSNGNGRHARLACNKLLEIMKEEKFTWGENYSTKAEEIRKRHIQALRAADKGDYGPLLEFVRS